MITVCISDLVVLVIDNDWYIFKHNGKVILIDIFESGLVLLLFLKLFEVDEIDNWEDCEDEIEEI